MPEISRYGGPRITRQQAQERCDRVGTIVSYRSRRTNEFFFFAAQHLYSHHEHAAEYGFVPCTTCIPLRVAPRPGLEDGYVHNVEQYIALFHPDAVEIDPAEKYGWGAESKEAT